MASPAKRICIAKITESTIDFDLQLRTTYPHNSREMNACLEITPKIQKPNKEKGVGLIVLADISASMLEGTKLCNLIAGIRKTSELSKTLKPRFTLLTFNQETNVVYDGDVPPAEDINKICDALRPTGPTNIGVALQRAVELATDSTRAGQPTHILLFTDGEDMSDLRTRITDGDVEYVKTLRTAPSLFVHCVGICSGIDCALLDTISRTARRGTFQSVSEDNISMLMGAMWGLMIEAVDATSYVRIDIDGAPFIDRKDVVLRICDPPKSCVATLVIGTDSFKTVTLTLGGLAVCDETDPVCNFEYARHLHAECCTHVALALRCGDYDKAAKLNMDAREVLLQLPSESTTTAVSELEAQAHEIDHARQNREAARELEAREMSRAATERNYGVSIDPTSRSLSDLQTQLLF